MASISVFAGMLAIVWWFFELLTNEDQRRQHARFHYAVNVDFNYMYNHIQNTHHACTHTTRAHDPTHIIWQYDCKRTTTIILTNTTILYTLKTYKLQRV